VHFFPNTIAFTTPVPRQEDTGHDLLCALAERHDEYLWAGPSFAVQVKSTTDPIEYTKPHLLEWIRNQENPFFVAVGNKKTLCVELYSTWWW
jgi:hypothetical protein